MTILIVLVAWFFGIELVGIITLVFVGLIWRLCRWVRNGCPLPDHNKWHWWEPLIALALFMAWWLPNGKYWTEGLLAVGAYFLTRWGSMWNK